MNFEEYILQSATAGIDKFFVKAKLNVLSKSTESFYINLSISGCLVSDGSEMLEDGSILLGGATKHFNQSEKVIIEPSDITVIDSETLSFNKFSDSNEREYYVCDETGMFLESQKIQLSRLTLNREPKLSARSARLKKVQEYFDRYRVEHQMQGLSDNEIYKQIGSPTREKLWNDLHRLWPNIFRSLQRNDFSYSPLREIDFPKGTGVSRKKINPLLSKG